MSETWKAAGGCVRPVTYSVVSSSLATMSLPLQLRPVETAARSEMK